MPRGQKSKHHAHAKRNQACGDAQVFGGAQESAKASAHEAAEAGAQKAEESSASFLSQSDFELALQEVKDSVVSTVILSCSASDKSFYEEFDEHEEKIIFPEVGCLSWSPYQRLLSRKALLLLHLLLSNYERRRLSTKEEMLNLLTKRHETDFPEILRRASEKLERAFAVEVREVDSSGPTYNLISMLKLPNNGRIRAGKGLPKTGFLMSILAIIFIRGNSISEEDMWKILKKRQIYPRRKHPIYGEPRKLITEHFVRVKYLEYRQVAGSDPPRYEFLWGPQAHAEKVKVLLYLDKINSTAPSAISTTCEEASQEAHDH
ncbi:melanoma-associated antigen B5-like [Nannospalax galili]|uniref:melanoma-associated antigen B5-like n=1 Tax=Nannospalax galili TaxID=1026970 RepID=UPI0004ED3CFE|nr:melanoma-associated antigen B5-like [Nannospalax galili]